MGVENSVKAPLGTDIEAPICQYRHDLSWRQRRKFGLVAGEEDPLAFFFAEAVRDMTVAALTSVHAITVRSKLPAPALQRRQAHAEQQGQLTGPGTMSHALIEDLQGLPAIARRRQSSPSSPQKA